MYTQIQIHKNTNTQTNTNTNTNKIKTFLQKYQMRELDKSSAHNSKTTLAHNLVFLDNKEKGGGGEPIQERIQIIVL